MFRRRGHADEVRWGSGVKGRGRKYCGFSHDRDKGFGVRVQGLELRVSGSGFRAQDFGFRV